MAALRGRRQAVPAPIYCVVRVSRVPRDTRTTQLETVFDRFYRRGLAGPRGRCRCSRPAFSH